MVNSSCFYVLSCGHYKYSISTTVYFTVLLRRSVHQYFVCAVNLLTVADLRGARGTPPEVQILSISGSFWENLAKSYVGAPQLG